MGTFTEESRTAAWRAKERLRAAELLTETQWSRASVPWLRVTAYLHDRCRYQVSYRWAGVLASQAVEAFRLGGGHAAREVLVRAGLTLAQASEVLHRLSADPSRRLGTVGAEAVREARVYLGGQP